MITKVLRKYFLSRNLAVQLFRRTSHVHYQRISRPQLFSTYSINEDIFEVGNGNSYSVKKALYPMSNDVTIKAINDCTSLEELTKFVDTCANLNKQQLCQLIIVVGDHVKMIQHPPVNPDGFLLCLNRFLNEMTIKEMSCCFHYLHKMNVDIRHPLMIKFSDKVVSQTEHSNEPPLEYLSHFTVGLNNGLYASMIAASLIPQVIRMNADCKDANDLYLLTICLSNISFVLTIGNLNSYKRKVEEFLDADLLNESSPKILLKIINFLNYPHWSFRNDKIIRRLLLKLEDHIEHLEPRMLLSINRAFHSQLESARLVPLLVKRAQELLEVEPNVDILRLAVLKVTPEQRVNIAEKLRNFLQTNQISSIHASETLQTVFKILRLLKISDIDMCDNLWTKVINDVYAATEPNLVYVLSRYIYKYMYFNNNLGGTYRHIEFESNIIKILMVELKKTLIPKDFAMFSSFVIAYGDGSDKNIIPQFIIDKIAMLNEQFTIRDCVQISRGVQMLFEMQRNERMSNVCKYQLEEINFSLSKSAERHLKTEGLHLAELNGIIRAYNTRRAPKDCSLFHEMINRYNSGKESELNSRLIKDICFNLTNCNFRMDSICEQMIDYTLENWEHMTGDTVEKILSCCYNFSYFPEKFDFFDRCCEIIIRDINYMSGLSIVQASMALVFFKACPLQLISMVFSSDFLGRVEQEIAMCYSKNIYPQRVMNEVMQLNRAVCLDYPELNVRWFQQSFVEAQASKLPVIRSKLHSDVKNILLSFVKKPDYLRIDWVTPYGYRIDFELSTDQYNRFILPPPEDYEQVNFLPHINKIAVLILNSKKFCENDMHRVKGEELLRMRHLEMLGYKVVHVKAYEFNSLFKNFQAKINYLKNLLQLTG